MVRMPIQNKIPTTLEQSVREIHKIWQTCWIKDNSLSIKLAGRGSMLHTAETSFNTADCSGYKIDTYVLAIFQHI
jgi:hypothetical protein